MGEVDLWSTLWAPLLVVLGMALMGALAWGARRFFKRLDDQDAALGLLRTGQSDLALELAKQFGGNSGGLRQAINEQGKRFDEHMKFHAEQHPR